MAGVAKYTISEISPNMTNVMLVAIIIGKQRPRTFPSGGQARSVWNFTIRDSATDTINVAAWGDEGYIFTLAQSLNVGDVVEITNPRVLFRQEEQYHPAVSSEFTLTLSETHSTLQKHEEVDVSEQMQQLLHVPTKPTSDFITLADVERKTEGQPKEFVDLLVAVCKLGEVRQITLRSDGSSKLVRDIILLDYTASGTMLTLWDQDIIHRSKHWLPGQTILFLADVAIEYNNFKRRPVVSTGPRTIITEDPACDEAHVLRAFSSKAPLVLDDEVEKVLASVNPLTITTVMSVKQLQDQMCEVQPGQHTTALLYCFLTSLDIDAALQQALSSKCQQCSAVIDERVELCEVCVATVGYAPPVLSKFNLRVTLSDHTGTLSNVRLTGDTAANVLGVSEDQYLSMGLDERTLLKWRLLLERCIIRILVMRSSSGDSGRHVVSIVSCEPSDPMEAASRMPMN